MHKTEKWKWSHSVVSDSLRPHGLQPTRLLRPQDFPGKSTGVGCHYLLWPRQHIKKQRHYFANKGPSSHSYGFASSHVWMWELDYKESWALKNWCSWTVLLEKTLQSPLDSREIQPVHRKGNQFWIFIGRTEAEAEAPILWQSMRRTDSLEKTLMLGKIEGKGEGNDRGWDGWMASLAQWTWVRAHSRRWWRMGKAGVLQSMRSDTNSQTQLSGWTTTLWCINISVDSFSSFLQWKPKRFFWYLPWESCIPGDIVPFPLPWLGPSAVFSSQNCASWASTISSVIIQVSPPPALACQVVPPHESVSVSCDSL